MLTLPTLKSRVEIAIARMIHYCPPEGYHLAFSGGKDSTVVERLAWMAGVPYVCHYGFTTVDPPQITKFIRQYYPEVIWHRPELSMWQLIIKKGIPPTRNRRYCCQYLKEYLGAGEFVITGIRKEESQNRANRQMVHVCFKDKTKFYLHPIIDWTTEDVWEFISDQEIPYCSLYDKGFKRIGCVMCPLASINIRRYEAVKFHKFFRAYMRTFDMMLKRRKERGKTSSTWHCAKDVMDWWLKTPTAKDPEEQLYFTMFT